MIKAKKAMVSVAALHQGYTLALAGVGHLYLLFIECYTFRSRAIERVLDLALPVWAQSISVRKKWAGSIGLRRNPGLVEYNMDSLWVLFRPRGSRLAKWQYRLRRVFILRIAHVFCRFSKVLASIFFIGRHRSVRRERALRRLSIGRAGCD